jgi:hypothetical protein
MPVEAIIDGRREASLMILWALAAATSLQADKPGSDRDWAAALRTDATAVHDAIAENHPGMINPGDPHFAAQNDRQYALALKRAQAARTFADYFFALQHYLAAFDDGHLGFGVFGATPDATLRWPGFIAQDDGNRGLIVTASEDWSGVAVGSRVQNCDGKSAFELGRDRIGARFGRWELEAQRAIFGAIVMLDSGDPYVRPINTCVFQTAKGTQKIRLTWREGGKEFFSKYPIMPARKRAETGIAPFAGGYWVTLPSFDGNPESNRGRALEALLGQIRDQATSMEQAPVIVFDLRGNGGGTSRWSQRIAAIIWGEGAFARYPAPLTTVVWRASDGNLQSLREGLQERDANGKLDEGARKWFKSSITGLEAAIAKGEPSWVIKPDRSDASSAAAMKLPLHPPRGKVYILTDFACMSACLDAVDLWTRFGAIPIGRETGADTVYMEVRRITLPSKLGSMSLPMKYYVGRPRGSNVPVKPVYRFDGDIQDTPGVQAWVSMLLKQA